MENIHEHLTKNKWVEKWKDKVRDWRGRPTPRQLSNWELDGGYHEASDKYVLINGRLCTGYFARTFAFFAACFKRIECDLLAAMTLFKRPERKPMKPMRRAEVRST